MTTHSKVFRDPAIAGGEIRDLFEKKKTITAVAESLGVSVGTLGRWCRHVAHATKDGDPRSVVMKRVGKTEFGNVVIRQPKRAHSTLVKLFLRYKNVVHVAEVLGVKSATVSRWIKTLEKSGLVDPRHA